MRISPRLRAGRWYVDLRGAGGGQHFLDAGTETEAIHEAYARLGALAPPAVSSEVTRTPLRDVVERFRALQDAERRRPASASYVRQYLSAVARELGDEPLSAFEPPAGNALLLAYRNRLVDAGCKPRTRRNRFSTLLQVLRFAVGQGWLRAVPARPKITVGEERLNDPDWQWWTEGDFRRLRAGLYRGGEGRLRVTIPDPAERSAFVARRQLYLSVAFYAGLHTRDLDELVADRFSETGHFLRVNSKSARCVPSTMLRMPEQLRLDVKDELHRLGRPWYAGERVAGGHWHQPTKELNRTAKRLGLPPVSFRLFRRSTAYHLCLLGWPERDVAEYLGHVDTEMVRTVYTRVPVDIRSPARLEWTLANLRRFRGGPTAATPPLRFGPRRATTLHRVDDEKMTARVKQQHEKERENG